MSSLEIDQLKHGSINDQVKKLQIRLSQLSLTKQIVGEVDGVFGGKTERAVKLFQANNGLTPTGIVDDDTWLTLFEYRSDESISEVKGRWENFNTKEIVNPLFDHCPVRKWEELPIDIQNNLSHTMDLVQKVRSFIEKPMRINSTWRPQSIGSAHQTGKAVDSQLINAQDEEYLKIMDWLRDECLLDGFRAILEWKGNRPWLHIDRNFRDDGEKVLAVMYPIEGKMMFQPYEGKLPQSYV